MNGYTNGVIYLCVGFWYDYRGVRMVDDYPFIPNNNGWYNWTLNVRAIF